MQLGNSAAQIKTFCRDWTALLMPSAPTEPDARRAHTKPVAHRTATEPNHIARRRRAHCAPRLHRAHCAPRRLQASPSTLPATRSQSPLRAAPPLRAALPRAHCAPRRPKPIARRAAPSLMRAARAATEPIARRATTEPDTLPSPRCSRAHCARAVTDPAVRHAANERCPYFFRGRPWGAPLRHASWQTRQERRERIVGHHLGVWCAPSSRWRRPSDTCRSEWKSLTRSGGKGTHRQARFRGNVSELQHLPPLHSFLRKY